MTERERCVLDAFQKQNNGSAILTRPAIVNYTDRYCRMDKRTLNKVLLSLEKFVFIFRETTVDRGRVFCLVELRDRYPGLVEKVRKLKLLDDVSFFIIEGPPERYLILRIRIKD